MRNRRFRKVVLLVLVTSIYLVFGFKVPENADFVFHISSVDKVLSLILPDYNFEFGQITLFGKDSFGGISEILLGFMLEDERITSKAFLKLPIVVAIEPKFSEDAIAKTLAELMKASYIVTDLDKSTKKIQIGEVAFYTIRSKEALYLTCSEIQKMVVEDMLNSKVKLVEVNIPQEVDIYYKNFGTTPIGNWLYAFGDTFGKPVSEELKGCIEQNKIWFELIIEKNISDYEKTLLKRNEFYLSELNYVPNSKIFIGATRNFNFLPLLILLQELPEELVPFFTENIDIFLISGSTDLFMCAKYKPEYEKLVQFNLKEHFQYMKFDRINNLVNAWQGKEVGIETKHKDLENSLMYIGIIGEEEEDFSFLLNVQRITNGGIKITGKVTNLQKFLEKYLEEAFEETEEYYSDEYDYYEEEEIEEEDYEETFDEIEYETGDETEEAPPAEGLYEEEYEEILDENYVYTTVDNLVSVINYLIEKLDEGFIPTIWSLRNYPQNFLKRLEFFPAIGRDGTKYFTISFQLPSEEIGEAIMMKLEEYDIYSWIVYGKLIINYVIKAEE
ncbi:MAG: hypothetical protein N2Z58_07110 [Fervidobacterium sp.]|nr:hypothetical protein [Fervidobacterium sp.]